jgi:hypothetical protein
MYGIQDELHGDEIYISVLSNFSSDTFDTHVSDVSATGWCKSSPGWANTHCFDIQPQHKKDTCLPRKKIVLSILSLLLQCKEFIQEDSCCFSFEKCTFFCKDINSVVIRIKVRSYFGLLITKRGFFVDIDTRAHDNTYSKEIHAVLKEKIGIKEPS